MHPQKSALAEFIERHARILVLTGAGCSTASGIPDYRDADGSWKREPPVRLQAFMADARVRQRYWARSLAGWPRFRGARPNDAHRALAQLERCGRVILLVTQNVDGLHQRAGSTRVLDLHGRLDRVCCMMCGACIEREMLQLELLRRNPAWAQLAAPQAPDGDADLACVDFAAFDVPACERCDGVLKPEVVFFGESVPAERVTRALEAVCAADALLVVGSSLMVYSGYRFAHSAALAGKPIAAVNLGRTRADELLALKIAAPCASALAFLLPQGEASAPAAAALSAPAEWAGPRAERPA